MLKPLDQLDLLKVYTQAKPKAAFRPKILNSVGLEFRSNAIYLKFLIYRWVRFKTTFLTTILLLPIATQNTNLINLSLKHHHF